MTRAPFIVFEGIEGSGKTTQVRLLTKWLEDLGVDHITTREPGGTRVGERIRETVLHGVDLDIPPETELLLILAARAAFVRGVVRPALDRGKLVISDRFSWSTMAYQAYGRGLPLDRVQAIDAFATDGLVPDLYVFIDVSTAEGMGRQQRAGKVADRFEGEGETFLDTVRLGYLELVRSSDRVVTIDGALDPAIVQDRVRQALAHRFPGTFAAGSV